MIKKNFISTALGLLLSLALSSCSDSSSGSNPAGAVTDKSAVALTGLWLEKKDADELRSTGKLESKCDEILNHGGIVTNSINIADSGRVTAYTEDPAKRDLAVIGALDFSTKILTFSADWAASFGTSKLQATLNDGVLSFGEQYNSFIFVPTNALEMESYYKAQHACYGK